MLTKARLERRRVDMSSKTDELVGKVAIVTGAGRGIGRAIAIVLGREGARVACLDLDMARAEDTASLLRDTGVEAFALDTTRRVRTWRRSAAPTGSMRWSSPTATCATRW